MPENKTPGIAFRNNLFYLFLNPEYAELFKYYLVEPYKSTKRTNLFLGAAGKKQNWKNEERKFTRFKTKGEKEKDRCLLIQLHKKLYPELYDSEDIGSPLPSGYSYIEDEDLVWFEFMRFDCTYLAEKRIRPTEGSNYPIAWAYDWVIEVENIFEEFAHTLRSMLDIICSKRIAIFFTDYVIESENEYFLKEISEKFYQAWEPYFSSRHTDWIAKRDLCINALIFPDTYNQSKGIRHYLKKSKLVKWDQKSKTFISQPQYSF